MPTHKTKTERVTVITAPENNTGNPSLEEAQDEKIARLERELRMARLKADAYDEMINIAEKQFNISIKKSWYQTVKNLHARNPKQYPVENVCELFG